MCLVWIGVIRKRVRLAEIVGCEPIRIRWWYGWGIHLTPYGWLTIFRLRSGRSRYAWQKIRARHDDPHGFDAISVHQRILHALSTRTPDQLRTPRERALPLQLVEPAQRDGSLGVVDFVAAVERADPDPLKSGAFD